MNLPKKYKKRPVEIEAMHYDGNRASQHAVLAWILENDGDGYIESGYEVQGPDILKIKTLEGDMAAMPGDYIIRGVEGEFYPCKPGIFHATYEEVKLGTMRQPPSDKSWIVHNNVGDKSE